MSTTLLNNDYIVECPKELRKELKENKKNGVTTNWHNFTLGETFFSEQGKAYRVVEIDHDIGTVKLV